VKNMTRVILPEHMKRFEFYTRRIKKFRFPSRAGMNFSISPHIYIAIAKLRKMEPFTSLTELFVPDAASLAQFPGTFLLSSQSLSAVYIHGIGPEEAVVTSLLHDISSNECNIQKMGIRGMLTSVCLDALSAFKYLKTLSVVNGNAELTVVEFLRPISYLKALTDLQLTLGKDSKLTFPKIQGGGKPTLFTLCALEILTITGSATDISKILFSAFPPEITKIVVVFTSIGAIPRAAVLCARNIQSWKAQHLRSIRIYSDYEVKSSQMVAPNIHSPMGCPISSGGLIHLSQLYCPMESAFLEIHPYVLNRSTVHFFENSFNTLTRLSLTSSIPPQGLLSTETENLMRISDLNIFSIFPNLESLTTCVIFNVDSTEEMKKKSRNQHIGQDLQKLTLLPFPHHDDNSLKATTSIMKAFGLARYIDHLFPNIKMVDMSKNYRINQVWRDAVRDMIKELQELRKLNERRPPITARCPL